MKYDIWRGPKSEDVGAGRGLTIFGLENGTWTAYNIVKTDAGEWELPYGSTTMTRVNPQTSSSNNTSSNDNNNSHSHHYEWEITTEPTETTDGVSSYRCTSCGHIDARQPVSASFAIRHNLAEAIKKAGAGATVTFDNKAWLCYPQYILDVLKERGDVSLKTDFTYEGVKYSFTIPAGSDYSNLEPADFYGFMYLLGAFGGTVAE